MALITEMEAPVTERSKHTQPEGLDKPAVAFVNALSDGHLSDLTPSELQVLAFLLRHGGDFHTAGPIEFYTALRMPRRSFFRSKTTLLKQRVVVHCEDRRCLHRRFGSLGLRLADDYMTWLSIHSIGTLEEVPKLALWRAKVGTMSAKVGTDPPTVTSPYAPIRGVKKRGVGEDRQSRAAPPPGTLRKEPPVKKHKDDWDGPVNGDFSDPSPVEFKKRDVVTAMQEAAPMQTVTNNYAKTYGMINKMLQDGNSSGDIVSAARLYASDVAAGTKYIPPGESMWDGFAREKADYLTLVAVNRIGARPDEADPTADARRKAAARRVAPPPSG